jgi:hypothetical protein
VTGSIIGECAVSAEFTIIGTYSLLVEITGKERGIVTSSPEGIICKDDCKEIYDHGTEVVLTAQPDAGSSFIGWSGDCFGQELTCTVTMDRAKTVSAEFYSFFWPMFWPAINGYDIEP